MSQQRSRCREQPGCREEPDSGPGSPSMCDFGWIPCLRACLHFLLRRMVMVPCWGCHENEMSGCHEGHVTVLSAH